MHLRAGWSFTHCPMSPENQAAVRQAAAKGLVVNSSTESRSATAVFRLEGVRFVACPASRQGKGGRKVQCISCGGRFGVSLCAQAGRPFVITFPAHGPRAAPAAAHCS
jgi:hypothetical protein